MAPPKDAVQRNLAWAQVLVNIFYQILENGAYLASKGVLGWDEKKQTRAWVWSSRFWAAHVGFDFGRLGYDFYMRRKAASKAKETKKEGGVLGAEEVRAWRREMAVNLAYAPLTVHWSLEEGLVSDLWVGLLGSVAGVVGFRELWKNTSG